MELLIKNPNKQLLFDVDNITFEKLNRLLVRHSLALDKVYTRNRLSIETINKEILIDFSGFKEYNQLRKIDIDLNLLETSDFDISIVTEEKELNIKSLLTLSKLTEEKFSIENWDLATVKWKNIRMAMIVKNL